MKTSEKMHQCKVCNTIYLIEDNHTLTDLCVRCKRKKWNEQKKNRKKSKKLHDLTRLTSFLSYF